jgi:hypothetical protein
MATTTFIWPEKVRKKVDELYNHGSKTMPQVIKILEKEFPKLAKRMTPQRLHSVARQVRLQNGTKPKHKSKNKKKKKSKKASISKWRSMGKDKREEVLAVARKLRNAGYRWGAIVDDLKVKFPHYGLPTPGNLAMIIKGRKAKNTNSNEYTITIETEAGTTKVSTTIPARKAKKLINELLEI